MAREKAKRIEVKNAVLEVTIVAKFDLGPGDMPDLADELERALDALRGSGEANITQQRILGEPVDG